MRSCSSSRTSVHQFGHVVFSALTLDVQAYLRVPAATPLARLTGNELDTRDVYSTLHGVFTEAWMSLCLEECYEMPEFTSRGAS